MLFSLSAITASAITFREFEHVSNESLLNFLLGFLLSAIGVSILTRSIPSSSSSILPPLLPSLIPSTPPHHLTSTSSISDHHPPPLLPYPNHSLLSTPSAPSSPLAFGRVLRSRESFGSIGRGGGGDKDARGSLKNRPVGPLSLGAGNYLLVREGEEVHGSDEDAEQQDEEEDLMEEDQDVIVEERDRI
jgi:hypothetical protein